MAGAFATRMQALGLKMIKKFGVPQLCTFVRTVGAGAYNPATASRPTANVSYTAWCAPVDYSTQERASLGIIEGNKKLYIAKGDYKPLEGDVVTIHTVDYRIQSVDNNYEVQGVECAYLCTIGV